MYEVSFPDSLYYFVTDKKKKNCPVDSNNDNTDKYKT